MSGSPIVFPCFREPRFEFLSIAPQDLSSLASAQINSLSYLDTNGFSRAHWGKSVSVYWLETLPGPYLEEFESYIEIFCDMCSSNWLVKGKGPANSTKKVNAEVS